MNTTAPRIFLHIGAMKTGTKHLQNLLETNSDSLAAAGYLFPGEHGWSDQVFATRDVLRMTGDARVRRRSAGMWDRLAGQMLGFDGHASIFSMEFLSFARKPGVQRIFATLEDAEVHVVLTVRDATRVIPAQWQTSARNGQLEPWREFAEQVMADPPRAEAVGNKVFQRAQNVSRMLGRWLTWVPPERFHVVTVPSGSAPRSLLWERFASVVGVDPAVCDKAPPTDNESIGAASADLVRRLNLELGQLTLSDYRAIIKTELATKILSRRAGQESRARTNQALRDFAARTNQKTRDAVTAAGVDVVGDLDDLPVVPATGRVDEPDELTVPSDEELRDAAAFAIPRLRDALVRRARRHDRAGGTEGRDLVATLTDLPATMDAARWDSAPDPLHGAVEELASVVRVGIELQRRKYARQDAAG